MKTEVKISVENGDIEFSYEVETNYPDDRFVINSFEEAITLSHMLQLEGYETSSIAILYSLVDIGAEL